MASHVERLLSEAAAAVHLSVPLVAGSLLEDLQTTLAHDLLSFHALLKASLLFSLELMVLRLPSLIVLSNLIGTLFIVVHFELLPLFHLGGHFFLALELLGQQFLHVLLLLVRVEVLLVQNHVPTTLSSLVLAFNIHASIEFRRHVASRAHQVLPLDTGHVGCLADTGLASMMTALLVE